ncbi:MAG: hypothetical protein E6Q40_07605 [Cupriavidus sp.]|nr:MAG: hypothetical protein E6Q40_07605 [Cupriavidus sp.]
MERLTNVRQVPMRDRRMLILRICLLLVIPTVIGEAIAGLYAGMAVGAWAAVVTMLSIPAALWWAVTAYVDGRLRKLQAEWDAHANDAAHTLYRVDYFYVGNNGAIAVDAQSGNIGVCLAHENAAFAFPVSAVRAVEIYKPGVTTQRINDVGSSVARSVKNFTDNMAALDAQIDGTGLFLTLDDLNQPKVFVQMAYADGEHWLVLLRRLGEQVLTGRERPIVFPAPSKTAALWSPECGRGSRVVGAIGVLLLAGVATQALITESAERSARRAATVPQGEHQLSAPSTPSMAAKERETRKAGRNAFLDGSHDESLNQFAGALHDTSAAPLNSLTLPMLYETKSGAKLDYTVVVRLGKANLDHNLLATAGRLDNPPTEAERIDAVKQLLGPLQETYKTVESAQSYLVPAQVVTTGSGAAWVLQSAAPGFGGGIYCAGGAFEMDAGGPIKQACVGFKVPATVYPRVGLIDQLHRGHQVFLKVRLSGAFEHAPHGLGDANTSGVAFGESNGRSVVARIAPVDVEAAYAFDPRTSTVVLLN